MCRKTNLWQEKPEKKQRRPFIQERQPKRPKPVFTDGRKLDNSRDWETVKVAKPPPEDLSEPSSITLPSTISTGVTSTIMPADSSIPVGNINSKSMKKLEIIRKELDGLQHDIEQSERIQGKERRKHSFK